MMPNRPRTRPTTAKPAAAKPAAAKRAAKSPAPKTPAAKASVTKAPAAKVAAARAEKTGTGTGIDRYRTRRDFDRTPEPRPGTAAARRARAPIFVVQEHHARRLHWDFRLEHGGVLWSWAVPKGPSMDTHDRRLAVHVEDHPLDYAEFHGTIPDGQYGAGTVTIWDHGTWTPVGDAEAGLAAGELKFHLDGERLQGGFVLVRLKPRDGDRAENWLLIKEHDPVPGHDAAPEGTAAPRRRASRRAAKDDTPPAEGARRAALPRAQAPMLATLTEQAPAGDDWLGEVKFDGYRLMMVKDGDTVRLLSRNAQDWTARLPGIARAVAALPAATLLLDGELVAPDGKGVASFAALQAALAEGGRGDAGLAVFLFDLLHIDGWDLRPCRLDARKRVLHALAAWDGVLRYSDHVQGDILRAGRHACALGLEGIVCKRAGSPYAAGRGGDWLKLKCQGREEFVVLGWTLPAGSRSGLGALHLGYYDPGGALHYAGGVGTGFSDAELRALRRRLDALAAPGPPAGLRSTGEPPERGIRWVRPELVAELRFIGWTATGRLRHAVYLGLRTDKPARDVVREPVVTAAPSQPAAEPDTAPPRMREAAARMPRASTATAPAKSAKPSAKPGAAKPAAKPGGATIVRARKPAPRGDRAVIGGVAISHPDRDLWPGITKRALAEYWRAVSAAALPEIARRPLAIVRCPDGIDGQHFFQKHAHGGMPSQIREGHAADAPYLAIDDEAGLMALAQMAAIEIHAWGATEADAAHPDRIVFDLDPGAGVTFADVVSAAATLRDRLSALGLTAFPRTTGGKGLHLVVPLAETDPWDRVRDFSHAFASRLTREAPDRFIDTVSIARRRGRILIDWLRNGPGSTAVASFSPRARPGATVATRLSWREVTPSLDPAAFTIATVPARLSRQRRDPWDGFADAASALPEETG